MFIDILFCLNWVKINVVDVFIDGGNMRSDVINFFIEIVNVIVYLVRMFGIIRGNIIFLKI